MKISANDMAHFLAREGASGSYYPREGVKVNYYYEDGKAQANMEIEDDLWNTVLEYCKLCRENEREIGQLKGGINGMSYLHWPYLDVILQARGLDYNQIMMDKDEDGLRAIYKIIETEFPAFKLTKRKLWQPLKGRSFH